jgi:hypothetical protein
MRQLVFMASEILSGPAWGVNPGRTPRSSRPDPSWEIFQERLEDGMRVLPLP